MINGLFQVEFCNFSNFSNFFKNTIDHMASQSSTFGRDKYTVIILCEIEGKSWGSIREDTNWVEGRITEVSNSLNES